jgi:hypothetical protein
MRARIGAAALSGAFKQYIGARSHDPFTAVAYIGTAALNQSRVAHLDRAFDTPLVTGNFRLTPL